MTSDASERAFKIFTEAYGKAWSPNLKGLAVMVAPTETESVPLQIEAPASSRVRLRRRIPSAP